MAVHRRLEGPYGQAGQATHEPVKATSTYPRAARSRHAVPAWFWPPTSVLIAVLLWWALVRIGNYPPYLLPSP